MKKLILFLFILTFGLVASSSAQQSTLGISAEVGIPTGDFGNVVSTGFGGIATFGYEINPELTLTLKSGYQSFPGSDMTIGGYTVSSSFDVIPVLAGAKYYFSPGETRFYGSADLGLYFLTAKATVSSGGVSVSASTSESDFGVAPNIGVVFKAGEKMDVDVHANYTNIFTSGSTTSWFGLGVGLVFGL